MANETCPHCGAGRRYMERYDCGTWRCAPDLPSNMCYQRQLATVTAERDRWRKDADEWLERYSLMCVRATDAERDRDELRRRIDEAPVWWTKPEAAYCDPSNLMVTLHEGPIPGGVAYRLVRDDQPTEDVPESSPHNP